MNNITVNSYLPLCEQYNSLAQSFFQQHLDLKTELERFGKPIDFFENPVLASKQNELTMGVLQTAICAVVFEAFAIESYVNFFGAYKLGDSTYYSRHESGEKGKRYSTIEKIKLICKNEFNAPYPTGDKHFCTLKSLFSKRDRLAHNKSKGHEISVENSNSFDDYYDAMSEIAFIYEGLEHEMSLYDSVKANLTASSGQKEPIAGFLETAKAAIIQSIYQMEEPIKPSIDYEMIYKKEGDL